MPDRVECFRDVIKSEDGLKFFKSSSGEGFLKVGQVILATTSFAEAVLEGGEEVISLKVIYDSFIEKRHDDFPKGIHESYRSVICNV